MIILGIDCSSKTASAAIIKDGVLICEEFINSGLTHSQTLLPIIEECITKSKIDKNEIDLIAVSNGPGSFTGIRIGISVVKGIAFTNNIPCCTVSTLEALSVNVKSFTGKIYSVLDARCSQVYFAEFKCENNEILRLCEDCAITLEELKDKVLKEKDNIIFVGDGSEICYNYLKNDYNNIFLSDINSRYCRASSVGMCANEKNAMKAENILPAYLRLPQAQRNLKKG